MYWHEWLQIWLEGHVDGKSATTYFIQNDLGEEREFQVGDFHANQEKMMSPSQT